MKNNNVRGIGGWLALLIFGLIFLGPLATAGRIEGELSSAEITYPALIGLEKWASYKFALWITWFIISAVSFYAGFLLWKRQIPPSVKFAKVALIVIGPLFALFHAYILVPLILAIPLDSSYMAQSAGGAIGAFVSAGVWIFYLSKSVRVRNTYGLTN